MMHPRCGRRNGIAREFDVQFATPTIGKIRGNADQTKAFREKPSRR
jgi:hypothetical protein